MKTITEQNSKGKKIKFDITFKVSMMKRVPQAESARKATVSIEITVIPAVSTAK